jgi:hypothetical protein
MKSTRGLVWIAGLAGLLAGISLNTHRRREAERRTLRVKPEPLQTWEGEGGAVPLRTGRTAQQVTPTSAHSPVGAEPSSGSGPFEQGGGPRYEQGGSPR